MEVQESACSGNPGHGFGVGAAPATEAQTQTQALDAAGAAAGPEDVLTDDNPSVRENINVGCDLSYDCARRGGKFSAAAAAPCARLGLGRRLSVGRLVSAAHIFYPIITTIILLLRLRSLRDERPIPLALAEFRAESRRRKPVRGVRHYGFRVLD